MISLKLLNEPTLTINKQAVFFKQKRSLAILIYCLFHSPVSRSSLCDLFWPDNDEATARKRLAGALFGLNKDCKTVADEIPALLLTNGRDLIKFNNDLEYHCDVLSFKKLAQIAIGGRLNINLIEQAIELYHGDFMQMFQLSSKVNPQFEHWIDSERAKLQGLYSQLLHRKGIHHLQKSDIDQSLKIFEQLAETQTACNDSEDASLRALRILCYGLLGQTTQVESLANDYDDYEQQSSKNLIKKALEAIHSNRFNQLDWPATINQLIEQKNLSHQSDNEKLVNALLKAAGVSQRPLPGTNYRRILRLAEREAGGFGFTLVGTPHLFLVLSADDNSYSDFFCQYINPKLNCNQLINEINLILDEAQDNAAATIGRTLELETVLQRAGELAEHEHQETIGMRHLWLALLTPQDSLIRQLLERYEINCDDCQQKLTQLKH